MSKEIKNENNVNSDAKWCQSTKIWQQEVVTCIAGNLPRLCRKMTVRLGRPGY